MYQFGDKIKFDLFGKSHAECIGGILEGIPAGMRIDISEIEKAIALRKPVAKIGTPRIEDDDVELIQGVCDGVTDGNPILMIIRNRNTDGSKYLKFSTTPRPGHADLPALVKFPEHDIRGGGQFSGRLTAMIVAAGNICKQFNRIYGIETAAYTSSVGNVDDLSDRTIAEAEMSHQYPTKACTEELDRKMYLEITDAGSDGDSIGGTITCITEGLPIGFGGIWFDALDALIARAIFGIPACKGIEFGKGFDLGKMRGSWSNDPYYYDNGIKTKSNNMGGITGGMSDGAPMVFRTVFKPTPSISKEQDTVNLDKNCNDRITVAGRHDPCIVPRAAVVVECMTAIAIADQIVKEKLME